MGFFSGTYQDSVHSGTVSPHQQDPHSSRLRRWGRGYRMHVISSYFLPHRSPSMRSSLSTHSIRRQLRRVEEKNHAK